MAQNNIISVIRTSVSGRVPNTTTMPNAGTLGLNMPDQILYSTDGTNYFAIGANLVNQSITNSSSIANLFTVGNSTVNTVINSTSLSVHSIFANSSSGSNGYVLTVNATGGIYWAAASGGGGTPGGANTQIQINESGTFGGSAALTFDYSSNALTIGNSTYFVTMSGTLMSGNNYIINCGSF